MHIYLIRHGETMWNREFRFQGHSDIPLSERGWEQSRLVAAKLAPLGIEMVFASDLQRAASTAAVIAATSRVPIKLLPGLREVDYGAWEGLTGEEIKQRFPEARKNWLKNLAESRPPDGESLEEAQQRALLELNRIYCDNVYQSVAVVTHGGIIAVLLTKFLDERIEFLRTYFGRNTNVSLIELQAGEARVIYWGDASHLDEAGEQ